MSLVYISARGSADSQIPAKAAVALGSGDCPHADAWADMLVIASRGYLGVAKLAERLANLRRAAEVFQEVERERASVARELHAGAGQPLAGIKLNVEILQSWAESMDEPARAALNRLMLLSEQALDQVRTLSHRLHPPSWQGMGMSNALRTLVTTSGVRERFGTTRIDIVDIQPEPGRAAKAAIYRCAQECISNAIRHSGASSFAIALQPVGDWLELRVSDDGCSIPDQDVRHSGLGLRAMYEHAASAGGSCQIRSGDQGTTVTVKVRATR